MRILKKKYWPGMIRIRSSDDSCEASKWCFEHLGKGRYYIIGATTFYFKTEEDATFFSLRWL